MMAKTVATPLERAINGVPGMTYMTTVCTNDGMSLTTVYFKVGTDPDVAAVNVQNRVTTVLDELPEEVIRAGVVTEKEVNSMLMYLNVFSTDTTHTEKFVYNFADINVLRELKRIEMLSVGRTLRRLPERQVSVPINYPSSCSTYCSTLGSSAPPKSTGKLCSRPYPTVRCCV